MQANHSLTGLKTLLVTLLMVVASVAQAERQPLDRVIAIVDDGVILQSELDARVGTIRSRLQAQGTGLPPRQVLEERVLDQLITENIQLQMAEQMGMRVSDNELNETINRIASSNNLTVEEFEEQLAVEGVSYQEAREQIRREMLVSRVQQRRVDSRVRVTDREVDNYLEQTSGQTETNTEYLLAHILVAVDNFSDQEAVASARQKARRLRDEIAEGRDFQSAAVAESDASNALEGGVMGWRSRADLPSLVTDIVPDLPLNQPSEVLQSGSGFHIVQVLDRRGGEARNVVEQARVRHILIRTTDVVSDAKAEQRINNLYLQLQNGADFAELAREHSDDPGSGSAGGDLGWVSPGQMVPAFEETMMNAPVGEFTRPFRSRFGWHILEVQERRNEDISDQVRSSEARQALYRRKYETELQNWLQEIRDEAYVEIKES
ncbi:peptidylprolyl isomerase [Marinobacter zhanjiangensis]|uniref:Chaperone SurA n=1 Tax=Marinobacter zhanjiangensis TaxID=578215 RepID=A0ABQ3AIT0_9GAMM|nr:peptidylprolyl isomerase [Marinobacter zhanjiangensis]GGY58071.1 chaperone SurA [Marinobacter zhanjiangensis]